MPILWGLLSLPTVLELAAACLVGKVMKGTVRGLPGYIYCADAVVAGLEYLRMPSMEELKNSDLAKETKKKSDLKKVKALARDQVYSGQAYQFPFFLGLAAMCNIAVVGAVCLPMRLLWSAVLTQSDAPAGMIAGTGVAPSDFCMIALFLLASGLLGLLHYACYSSSDSVGWGGNFAALVAALFAWGIIMVEEVEPLQFHFTDSYNAFKAHERHANGSLIPPYLVFAGLVFAASIVVSYGTMSTSWRLVRCHYQLSDRAADSLKNLEETRARQLLNYNMAVVNATMTNGDATPPAEITVDQYPFYFTFHQRVLSWVTLASPFLLVLSFLYTPWKTHANIHMVRQVVAAAMVTSRLLLCRTYLQTYLLRDTHEATRFAGKDQNKITQALSSVHSRAVLLLVRTAIMLLAPAMAMFALAALSVRMNGPNESFSKFLFGGRLANAVPAALMSHEFRAPADIPDGTYWRQLVSFLMFWLAASEAVYIFGFCAYRWVLSLVFRNQREMA